MNQTGNFKSMWPLAVALRNIKMSTGQSENSCPVHLSGREMRYFYKENINVDIIEVKNEVNCIKKHIVFDEK